MTHLLALFLTLLLPLQSFASVYPRSLTTQNAIMNTGKIQAGRNVQLVSTSGSISNNATVYTAASESGNYTSSFLQRVGEIFSGGDTTFVAKQDITNTGGTITAGNNANLIAESGNVTIDSAALHNREEKRGKRHYILDDATTHVASTITAGNDVNIAAAKDVAVLGSIVTASGDANLQAGENLLIGAVQNEETHVTQYTKKSIQKTTFYKKETYDLTHQESVIVSGGDTNLVSGGDMAIVGSKVTSNHDTNITTGGQLVVAATQDIHEVHEQKKTKAGIGKFFDSMGALGFGSDETASHDLVQTSHQGSALTSTQDINTASVGDTMVIASSLKAGGAVNITSGGTVNLLSAKDTEYEERKQTSDSINWQSMEGNGHTSETVKMASIESASLNVDASSINVDVRGNTPGSSVQSGSIGSAIQQVVNQANAANSQPDIKDIVAAAATQPGMGYLNQLKNDPRVKWNQVNNAYDQWDYKAQGLTPEGAAIVAIVVTIATGGTGAPAVAPGTSAAVAAGTATATQVAAVQAINASFSALAAQATITLANNQGNIGKTFKDLASDDTVRNLAVAALSAGATSGMTAGLGVTSNAAQSAINATSSATVQSIVNGEDFGKALTTQLKFAAANAGGTIASAQIGKMFSADGTLNNIAQAASHFAVGCASGALSSGSCAGGGAGAVTAEFAAEYAYNYLGYSAEDAAKFGEYSSVIAGVLVQDGSEGVTAAYQAGVTAAQNNWLNEFAKDCVLEGGIGCNPAGSAFPGVRGGALSVNKSGVKKATSAAESPNAGVAVKRKLSGLQDAQKTAVKTKELPDGRIRYYEAETAATKPGKTRGASFVTEYNPKTGQVKQWMENYDHSGNVIRVHPKSIDGQTIRGQHYPPTAKELGK